MLDGSGFHLGIAVLARELGYMDGRRVEARAARPRPRRRLLRRIASWIARGRPALPRRWRPVEGSLRCPRGTGA